MVQFSLNTSDSEIIIHGSIRLVTQSPHPQNQARADYNVRHSHIRSLHVYTRAMCYCHGCFSSPLLPLQTHVFHTRRLFSSLPRGFLPCQSQGRSLAYQRIQLYVRVYVTVTVFHSHVVYGFSNKDYGYCTSARRPLDDTFKGSLKHRGAQSCDDYVKGV